MRPGLPSSAASKTCNQTPLKQRQALAKPISGPDNLGPKTVLGLQPRLPGYLSARIS